MLQRVSVLICRGNVRGSVSCRVSRGSRSCHREAIKRISSFQYSRNSSRNRGDVRDIISIIISDNGSMT